MRNSKGQFVKGHQETAEQKEKRKLACSLAQKKRTTYLGEKKYSYLYNCWRSFRFTKKGKSVGNSKEWDSYLNYYNDMSPSYKEGLRLFRLDISKPFSKENCIWSTQAQNHEQNGRLLTLEYNGETKTIKEWCEQYKIPLNAVKQRYRFWKDKGILPHEILFGRKKTLRNRKDISEINKNMIRSKASKMIASYRCSDKKKGYECNLTIDFMVDKIFTSNCSYCATSKNIGCDRIDNSKGHTIDNVIPACYECNVIRRNEFTIDEMKKIGKIISEIKLERAVKL